MPSSNPAVLSSLMPGANISGNSVAVPPMPMSYGTQSIGGNTNPFLPVPSNGTNMPPMTNPSGPAPIGGGGQPQTGLGGTNPYNLWSPGQSQDQSGLQGAIKGTGEPGGIAALLASFLRSGAGFNPQVAQALFNAMGPQIERGTENIVEQFSAMGDRFGSPAAVGLGDFEAQVNLNMDQIFSQLYEQSVTDYLNVLMGVGKKTPTFGGQFASAFAGGLGSGVASLITG